MRVQEFVEFIEPLLFVLYNCESVVFFIDIIIIIFYRHIIIIDDVCIGGKINFLFLRQSLPREPTMPQSLGREVLTQNDSGISTKRSAPSLPNATRT